MSEEICARVRTAFLVRVLGALLLLAALVCGSAPASARRAGAGQVVFEAGGAIYLMDAAGGPATELVGRRHGVNMQPALSPDGSLVAFSSNQEGQFSIYVIGVDGSGLRRLTDGSADDSEPAWSPDGTHVAFVRGFDATGSGVVIMMCSRPEDIGNILVVPTTEVVYDKYPEPVNLTNGQGGTDPAWSPDGTRIAFASDRAGSYDIYTMSAVDGQDVQRLTTDTTAEADPSWSPDGTWIAYTGHLLEDWRASCGNMPIIGGPTGGNNGCKDENSNGICDTDENSFGDVSTFANGPYIYKMRPNGSGQKPVTNTGGAAEPAWSPDGSHLIFVGGAKGGDVNIYLIALDSTGPWINLTFDNAAESSPSWVGGPVR